MKDDALLICLSKHPSLRKRIESYLEIIKNVSGDIELANAAEERFIEEGRHLNREGLQARAQSRAVIREKQFEKQHKQVRKNVKKLYWHTTFGRIELNEQVYRVKGSGSGMRFRPLSESLGVHVRAYSRALQRAVCTFGADHEFR